MLNNNEDKLNVYVTDLHNIVFDSDPKCKICGGKVSKNSGCCAYCDEKDDLTFGYLHQTIEGFSDLLDNGGVSVSVNENTMNSFIKLWNCSRKIDIPVVREFVTKAEISKKIETALDELGNKLDSTNKLDDKENHLLSIALENEVESPDLIHFIMKNTFLKKQLVSYECFEKVLTSLSKIFAIEIISSLDADPNLYVSKKNPFFSISSELKSLGSFSANPQFNIVIHKNIAVQIYEGNLMALKTLFHEFGHFNQMLMIREGKFTPLLLQQIKETVLRDIDHKKNDGDSYYKNNYEYLKKEKDAEIYGYKYVFRYLDSLNLNVSQKFQQYCFQRIEEELKKNENNLRMLENYESISYEELFDIYIVDYPEYLTKYPQLCIEYVVDGNKVRKKTYEEMKKTCLNLMNKVGQQNELEFDYAMKVAEKLKMNEEHHMHIA